MAYVRWFFRILNGRGPSGSRLVSHLASYLSPLNGLLAVGLLLPTGCGSPEPVELETALDLVPALQWAESVVEPANLGIGSEAGRQFLGSGWWANEGPDQDRFVWGIGQTSELSLPIAQRRDLVLVLDLRPFTYPSSPPQQATVELNGERIHEFTLEPGSRGPVRLALPEERLKEGPSLLKLHWQWSRSPQEALGARDARQLAAALHGAWLCEATQTDCGPGGAVKSPGDDRRVRAQGDRIWMPWGSRADFFVELPANAWLQTDLGIRGKGRLSLTVLPQTELPQTGSPETGSSETGSPQTGSPETGSPQTGSPETGSPQTGSPLVRAKGWSESGPIRVFLGADPGWVRLRLVALGEQGEQGGARLELPVIARTVSEGASDVDAAEDGFTDDLAAAESTVASDAEPSDSDREAAPEALVVYSIDTLRADRLGYRGGPVATPTFDQFAEESVVFEQLTAQSPWTKASMASIFTGLWPRVHGAVNRKHLLDDRLVTLAELLHASGWATAAIVTNPNITETFGFDQGFEFFEYLGETAPAQEVNQVVERFLSQRQDDRPLFLWVHILDPHSPYDPPADFRRRRLPEVPEELAASSLDVVNDIRSGRLPAEDQLMDQLLALYHTEIAYSDASFARFLEILERFGLARSLVTVISDHGEEFLEHGNLEHGRALHVESLDVPWMIRGPGVSAQRLTEQAQHMDVLPTLLAALDMSPPQGLEGHAWITADGAVQRPAADRLIYSHLHLDGDERMSVSDGSFKLIAVIRGGEPVWCRLFDLRNDSKEMVDVIDRYPVRAGRFKSLLRQRLARGASGPETEVEFDEETRKSLEALGYI